jgi:hypothetical protein
MRKMQEEANKCVAELCVFGAGEGCMCGTQDSPIHSLRLGGDKTYLSMRHRCRLRAIREELR